MLKILDMRDTYPCLSWLPDNINLPKQNKKIAVSYNRIYLNKITIKNKNELIVSSEEVPPLDIDLIGYIPFKESQYETYDTNDFNKLLKLLISIREILFHHYNPSKNTINKHLYKVRSAKGKCTQYFISATKLIELLHEIINVMITVVIHNPHFTNDLINLFKKHDNCERYEILLDGILINLRKEFKNVACYEGFIIDSITIQIINGKMRILCSSRGMITFDKKYILRKIMNNLLSTYIINNNCLGTVNIKLDDLKDLFNKMCFSDNEEKDHNVFTSFKKQYLETYK